MPYKTLILVIAIVLAILIASSVLKDASAKSASSITDRLFEQFSGITTAQFTAVPGNPTATDTGDGATDGLIINTDRRSTKTSRQPEDDGTGATDTDAGQACPVRHLEDAVHGEDCPVTLDAEGHAV